jgi:hypothetical protein
MRYLVLIAALLAVPLLLPAKEKKLRDHERMELIRGLTSEFATVKVLLPRSKQALKVELNGEVDEDQWSEAEWKNGPAARVGDLVQITKVNVKDKEIEFELNGGWKTGGKWYERIQVSGGPSMRPVTTGSTAITLGTKFTLLFPEGVHTSDVAEIKKLLAPVLDFEQRSATEQYVENLPPEIQQAIEEERAVDGMDKDMVLLALGKPTRKVREEKDGEEFEDWIYGQPPGRMTFVRFNSAHKVVSVRETYAGLGTTMPDLPVVR